MPGPLAGVKVFDLSYIGVGPWATMILAAMGANVVKVEPQAWPPVRQGGGPMYKGLAVVYLHCQLGKRGIFVDLKTPDGQEVARKLVKDADVFVENMRWGAVERLGLGYEDVCKLNPRIVYGNYSGYGSLGYMRDWGSGDMVAQAFAGPGSITGKRGGDPEFIRWAALHDFNASSYIVATTLLGLLYRERTGRGLRMETPQQASSVAIQSSRIAEFLAAGENVPRMGSACTTTVPHRAFLCQNKRWLAVGVESDAQWRSLCQAIKSQELLEDARFATNSGRVQNRDEVEERLRAVFSTKPALWWVIQLRKRKVPVSLFYNYETIPDLPQVRANRLITSVQYPRVGALPFGNVPFQLSKTPVALKPGPWPGQDTERVVKEGWGGDSTLPEKGYFGPSGPMKKGVLDGVTVVDMTQGLTGPYASLLLADAGATVIKVEPPEGDYARGWGPPIVDKVSAVFFHLNRNKQGMRLDLQDKSDQDRLKELLRKADVFLEDQGQSRLHRLGLSYEDVEEENPGLVYCTITPFGAKGPLRDQPASELVLQAMSDFLNDLGVAGEEPVRMGPDMASLGTSLHAIHGILGAIYHKWRTREGQHVMVNMLGTLLFQRGIVWTGLKNPDEWNGFVHDPEKPPDHGYQAADRRIMPGSVKTKEELSELMKTVGMEAYLQDPLFQSPPNETFQGQAKPIWEAAFRKCKAEDLVALLAKLGSSAAVVNNYQQLLAHPQMEAMGLIQRINHARGSEVKFLGPPWKLHGVPGVKAQPYADP